MKSLIEKFNTTNLDLLCNDLTKEIKDLASTDYKLKLLFVLVHIVKECQVTLEMMDTTNLIVELKEQINEACIESEKLIEVQKLRFIQDKVVRDVIDGTNEDLLSLNNELESLLNHYESILKELIDIRNNLSIPERDIV